MSKQVTFNKGGTGEYVKSIEQVQIADLWHVGHHLIENGNDKAGKAVLDVWHIAHDLKKHIELNG
tara:strand:+ start:288 stop:482 length:195 start_codon:yes stop_codon:yes gene_type:complete